MFSKSKFIELLYIGIILWINILCFSLELSVTQHLIYVIGGLGFLFFSKAILKRHKVLFKGTHFCLLFVFSILFTFSVLDYSISVNVKGTPESPYLMESDPELYHNLAVILSRGFRNEKNVITRGSEARGFVAIAGKGINHIGYPFALGALYYVHQDLISGMMLSFLFGMLNFTFSVVLAKKIFNNPQYILYAATLTAISPHLLASGVILLKDVVIVTGFLLIATQILTQKWKISNLLLFAFGFIIILTFRASYILLIPIFGLLRTGLSFHYIKYAIPFALVIMLASQYSSYITGFSFSTSKVIDIANNSTSSDRWAKGELSASEALVGGFNNASFGKKIIMMPIPMTVQFVTPFDFWTTKFLYPWQFLQRNLNVIWFTIIGPLSILGFFWLFRYSNDFHYTKRAAVLGWTLFTMVAFIYAGVIPRYMTPFMPFLIQPGAYALYKIKTSAQFKKEGSYILLTFAMIGFAFVSLYIIYKAI